MKIERIYILTCATDVRLARCCVASIRRWYPDIPISLIKDDHKGTFDTSDFERWWDVDIFTTEQKRFGFGFGKLEPFFQERPERFLMLDADVVFLGRVLDRLEQLDEDFIVAWGPCVPDDVKAHYFDLEKLATLDPAFHFPGYVFNTGVLVATAGLVSRRDFAPYLDFQEPVERRYPDIFGSGEQGVLNYVLMRKAQEDQITIARARMVNWPPGMSRRAIAVRKLTADSPYQIMLHWAGPMTALFTAIPLGRVLKHFEAAYYARIPGGRRRRAYLRVENLAATLFRRRTWTRYA